MWRIMINKVYESNDGETREVSHLEQFCTKELTETDLVTLFARHYSFNDYFEGYDCAMQSKTEKSWWGEYVKLIRLSAKDTLEALKRIEDGVINVTSFAVPVYVEQGPEGCLETLLIHIEPAWIRMSREEVEETYCKEDEA